MKLLFLTPGLKFGGAERVISVLSNEWVLQGHTVQIMILGKDNQHAYPLSDAVKIIELNGLCKEARWKHLDLIRRMRRAIREVSPDIVVSFMTDTCAYAAIAMLGLHIPLIFSERNDPTKVNQRKIDRFYRKIVERFARGFVFQTEGARSFYPKYIQKKSTIILNPLSNDSIPTWDESKASKTVVSVGRLEPQKNQKLLIDAFEQVHQFEPDFVLQIFGSGSLEGELRDYIGKKGLENCVFLMGNSSAILHEIKRASMFVLSSDFEGLPNALMEAMAVGLPCISTDCSPGGARMLIKNGINGLIIPCKDSVALANAIKKLIQDPLLALNLGHQASKIKEKVSAQTIATDWIRFLSQFL